MKKKLLVIDRTYGFIPMLRQCFALFEPDVEVVDAHSMKDALPQLQAEGLYAIMYGDTEDEVITTNFVQSTMWSHPLAHHITLEDRPDELACQMACGSHRIPLYSLKKPFTLKDLQSLIAELGKVEEEREIALKVVQLHQVA